ncbi:hypothetical protein [Streptomyces thermolilacinus]|uniref:Uncharacterized protein n=1 Tax=Streptomyces thermolilacinus SPC6 TaxID=1306406 RepID=A0A1D3DRB9_9ACTN|nr:hypothetical protein [Streptomyces thermolilacinus]OEJ94872.1 hypothetical protein J116_010635 [Streptomyces thermolilacinus SPC6]
MSEPANEPVPLEGPVELVTDPAHPVEVVVEEHSTAPAPAPDPDPEPPAPDTPVPGTAPVVPVSGGGQEEIA